MKWKIQVGIVVLLLSTLACEPVMVVGWRELSCIFVLIMFLFGPPLYRFVRKFEKYRRQKEK